ncbi:hypothetical protein E4U60_005748 [Claviceps pazoutovae]|uniref:Uncharacterized protein n=1 Tax=Claviceps pazoutovae TaxID=1649127 RepID=A0A9P7M7E1_9HYPO|nr:hypothetical protein E4U60_005748 [Claviceps pazoutovae]
MHALSLLALLLPLVAADSFSQCDCKTASDDGKWTSDPALTHWVCYNSYANTANFDANVGGCVSTQANIDGDTWQQSCIDAGVSSGYYAFGSDGKPITNVPAMKVAHAAGQCPK